MPVYRPERLRHGPYMILYSLSSRTEPPVRNAQHRRKWCCLPGLLSRALEFVILGTESYTFPGTLLVVFCIAGRRHLCCRLSNDQLLQDQIEQQRDHFVPRYYIFIATLSSCISPEAVGARKCRASWETGLAIAVPLLQRLPLPRYTRNLRRARQGRGQGLEMLVSMNRDYGTTYDLVYERTESQRPNLSRGNGEREAERGDCAKLS